MAPDADRADGQYRSNLRRRRTQALRVIRAIASEVTRTRP